MVMLMMIVMAMLVRVRYRRMGVPMRMFGLAARMRMVMMIIVRVLVRMGHRFVRMGMLMIRHVGTSLKKWSLEVEERLSHCAMTIFNAVELTTLTAFILHACPTSSAHAAHWSHTHRVEGRKKASRLCRGGTTPVLPI